MKIKVIAAMFLAAAMFFSGVTFSQAASADEIIAQSEMSLSHHGWGHGRPCGPNGGHGCGW